MKLPFVLPPRKRGEEAPVWVEGGFRIGENWTPVLRYSDSHLGWTDDLTRFHENIAGSNHWIDKSSRQYAAEQIKKHLRQTSNKVILEIGSSSGEMLRLMRKEFSDSLVIGSDCISDPLEHLAKEFPDTPMIQFDLLRCPLPGASVDAVVLLNVLEHIEGDVAGLGQILRILKPGGVLVLEVPSGPSLYDIYDKTLMHYRRYSLSGLSLIVQEAGFEIARRSHLGFLVFPGFWLVKKRNRRFLARNKIEFQNVVKKNISKTRHNGFLGSLMSLELFFGRVCRYPVGIRCVMTCLKPG